MSPPAGTAGTGERERGALCSRDSLGLSLWACEGVEFPRNFRGTLMRAVAVDLLLLLLLFFCECSKFLRCGFIVRFL